MPYEYYVRTRIKNLESERMSEIKKTEARYSFQGRKS